MLQCQDRPLLYGELLRIRDRLGREAFPLIDMQYFANLSAAHTPLIAPALPLVAKVSNTHAGFGKARFGAGKSDEFDDFRSVLALHTDYFTTEPFVERVASEYRVQRIGEHVRVYKRQSDSGWKGNWGDIRFADLPVEDRHRRWAEEASRVFGGLELLALDVLVDADGNETIIELNDTAAGMMFEHEAEDCARLREMLLRKMRAQAAARE